mmetsp:Transcript_2779/g.4030  ORF Transcript_2779/g.4030 Transcript_2779/m.4030 type:complete len:163 (+) Transcript_2779:87-575(+)|eukprot:CAMPEP_0203672176 /NCGR_PEP_ID=MMETSP0090-20130426/7754_1 /ASSEMBLY_ACC=CAM_ASM_001088 /TAXON_ID=426623 /ORGANISM="Chaetoceros affinis, Strain CCMP159" /LENGTH=162 /DNA_ID=CAMNT_0050537435 /DNA_START=67 /DNA_END=555 /DNA_ORIENTATION=-
MNSSELIMNTICETSRIEENELYTASPCFLRSARRLVVDHHFTQFTESKVADTDEYFQAFSPTSKLPNDDYYQTIEAKDSRTPSNKRTIRQQESSNNCNACPSKKAKRHEDYDLQSNSDTPSLAIQEDVQKQILNPPQRRKRRYARRNSATAAMILSGLEQM